MWVVWACELMGCVSAHSVVFFKDDANHFGEIGIDVPSVYPFSGASQLHARGRCVLRRPTAYTSPLAALSTVKRETIVLGIHPILGMAQKSILSTQTFRRRPLPQASRIQTPAY